MIIQATQQEIMRWDLLLQGWHLGMARGTYAQGVFYMWQLTKEDMKDLDKPRPPFNYERYYSQYPDRRGALNPFYGRKHTAESIAKNRAANLGKPCRNGRYNSKKTHCPSGHEYSTANTYVSKQGKRACIACTLLRNNARRAALNRAC